MAPWNTCGNGRLPLLCLLASAVLWSALPVQSSSAPKSASPASEGEPLKEVRVSGKVLDQSNVGQQSCFKIQVFNAKGGNFESDRQKAFLVGLIRGTEQGIVQALDIQYDKRGSHTACYFLEHPGTYELQLFLDFNNTDLLISRLDDSLVSGYEGHRLVVSRKVKVAAIASRGQNSDVRARRLAQPMKKPPCTMAELARTGNRGYWNGVRWVPLHCKQEPTLERDAILKCLDGKRLAIVGDSQMRYLFATLRTLLMSKSVGEYLEYFSQNPKAYHMVPPRNKVKGVPDLDLERENSKLVVKLDSGATPGDKAFRTLIQEDPIEYLGTNNIPEGFAVLRVQIPIPGKKDKFVRFNVTYLSQQGAAKEVVHEWMTDRTKTGGWSLADQLPFDRALVGLSLHDLVGFKNSQQFAQRFSSKYLSELEKLVRRPSDLAFLGMWAAQAGMKPMRYMHKSNNARGFVFEDAAVKILQERGFKNVVLTRHMTLPREDMCLDSTHYAWPFTFATLDLFASDTCTQPQTS